jgi:type VI secretion system protein ImpG
VNTFASMTDPADMSRLYSQEMRALEEDGASFARDFPEAARYLDSADLEDRDPYVERLTEASANLFARIRQSMGTEEMDRSLLEMIAPELVQPLPSVSVVRFHQERPLVAPVTVPAGAMIRSKPLPGCPSGVPFRLLDSVDVTLKVVEPSRWEESERGEPSWNSSFAGNPSERGPGGHRRCHSTCSPIRRWYGRCVTA